MRDAGVPILAGTDQAPDGTSLHRELELLVEAGLSPSEALAAATGQATAFLGLSDELGTVEEGKRADLTSCCSTAIPSPTSRTPAALPPLSSAACC